MKKMRLLSPSLAPFFVVLLSFFFTQAHAMRRPNSNADDDVQRAKSVLREERDRPAEFNAVRNLVLAAYTPDDEPDDDSEWERNISIRWYQWLNASFLAAGVSLFHPNPQAIQNRLLSEADFPHEWLRQQENLAPERARILSLMDALRPDQKLIFAQTLTRLKNAWLDDLNAQIDAIQQGQSSR